MNAGVANGAAATVRVNIAVALPLALVAVIVYVVAPATDVGVPVRAPVEILKLMPGGVALIAKLAMVPPVELMVKPIAAVLTVLVSEEEERVKVGTARVGVGSTTTGGGGVRVVIAAETVDGIDVPTALLATIVKV